MDAQTAKICEVIARCNGAKNVKLADFLTLRREIDNNPVMDTSERITGQLMTLSAGMGG